MSRARKLLAGALMVAGVVFAAPGAVSAEPAEAPVQCWELARTSQGNATVILWRCLHTIEPDYHGQIINGTAGDIVLVRRGSFTVMASAKIPQGATSADTEDVGYFDAPYQVCYSRDTTVGNCTGFWS